MAKLSSLHFFKSYPLLRFLYAGARALQHLYDARRGDVSGSSWLRRYLSFCTSSVNGADELAVMPPWPACKPCAVPAPLFKSSMANQLMFQLGYTPPKKKKLTDPADFSKILPSAGNGYTLLVRTEKVCPEDQACPCRLEAP